MPQDRTVGVVDRNGRQIRVDDIVELGAQPADRHLVRDHVVAGRTCHADRNRDGSSRRDHNRAWNQVELCVRGRVVQFYAWTYRTGATNARIPKLNAGEPPTRPEEPRLARSVFAASIPPPVLSGGGGYASLTRRQRHADATRVRRSRVRCMCAISLSRRQ